MILPLVPDSDPALHTPTKAFEGFGAVAAILADNLIETMRAKNGAGLSANQCGLPFRVFVMENEGQALALFNPEVIRVGSDLIEGREGCLSFPGMILTIKRPRLTTVRYQDAHGAFHEAKFKNFAARCALHEIDHLDGITFLTRSAA